MKPDFKRDAPAAALLIVLLATASDQGVRAPTPETPSSPAAARRTAKDLIADWPETPRVMAAALLQRYGVPDEIVSSQLSWNGRRPWAKIVVFRDPDAAGRSDHLLESLAYGRVDLDRWKELSGLGRGAAYDPVTQELSARTDSEATNFLALNLADEVIRGRRSAADARGFYDAALNLSLYGKSTPYMSRLLFQPRR
jgi:hypothetical protein